MVNYKIKVDSETGSHEEIMDIEEIKFFPMSSGEPDAKKLSILIESIKKYGLLEPPLVNEENYIIHGNFRVSACIALGYKKIRVFKVPFEEEHSIESGIFLEKSKEKTYHQINYFIETEGGLHPGARNDLKGKTQIVYNDPVRNVLDGKTSHIVFKGSTIEKRPISMRHKAAKKFRISPSQVYQIKRIGDFNIGNLRAVDEGLLTLNRAYITTFGKQSKYSPISFYKQVDIINNSLLKKDFISAITCVSSNRGSACIADIILECHQTLEKILMVEMERTLKSIETNLADIGKQMLNNKYTIKVCHSSHTWNMESENYDEKIEFLEVTDINSLRNGSDLVKNPNELGEYYLRLRALEIYKRLYEIETKSVIDTVYNDTGFYIPNDINFDFKGVSAAHVHCLWESRTAAYKEKMLLYHLSELYEGAEEKLPITEYLMNKLNMEGVK